MRPIAFLSGIIVGVAGFAAGTFVRPAPQPMAVLPAKESPTAKPSVADPIARAMAVMTRGDFGLKEMAEISAQLRTLDRVKLAELANRLERLPSSDGRSALHTLLNVWARRDPEGATEWMRPRLEDCAKFGELFFDFGRFDTEFVMAWAVGAPEKALEYVRSHPRAYIAEQVLEMALGELDEKSYAEQLEIVRSIPEAVRKRVLINLFNSWAETNMDEALSAAKALPPGDERDRMTGEVLTRLAAENPKEAFRQFAEAEILDAGFVPILVTACSRTEPVLTAQWLEDRGDPAELERSGSLLVIHWAAHDPSAALEWAKARGISITEPPRLSSISEQPQGWLAHQALMLGQSPLETAVNGNAKALIEWLKKLPAGAERTRLIKQSIESSYRKPDELLALASDLPPDFLATIGVKQRTSSIEQQTEFAGRQPAGPAREAAWRAIGQGLYTDPPGIAPGPDRDAMLAGMAVGHADRNKPIEEVWALVEQISDPMRRRNAFDDLALMLDKRNAIDGVGAFRKLIALPNVPEEWKQPWRGVR